MMEGYMMKREGEINCWWEFKTTNLIIVGRLVTEKVQSMAADIRDVARSEAFNELGSSLRENLMKATDRTITNFEELSTTIRKGYRVLYDKIKEEEEQKLLWKEKCSLLEKEKESLSAEVNRLLTDNESLLSGKQALLERENELELKLVDAHANSRDAFIRSKEYSMILMKRWEGGVVAMIFTREVTRVKFCVLLGCEESDIVNEVPVSDDEGPDLGSSANPSSSQGA